MSFAIFKVNTYVYSPLNCLTLTDPFFFVQVREAG